MSRILGIDYGTRRVGLAVSDPMGIVATPLRVLEVVSDEAAVREVKRVCREQAIEAIVVGMPFNMDGTRGPSAEAAEKFAGMVREKTGLTVETWDERLSTSMVERVLIDGGARREKRKQVRDKLAAQVILQGYLDAKAASTMNDDPDRDIDVEH